jgi:two-component flavin-dependent monooxygenase
LLTASVTAGQLDARRVAELARASASALVRDRRLTPELAEAITEVGFSRHFVPQRFGGAAGTFNAVTSAVAAVGEACASTAWCAALYAAHGRLASYLPDAGQAQVWETGPDARIAAAINPPGGQAVPVPGGWQLTGRWSFASGVDHAQWVLLASWTGDPQEHRIFAVRRADCQVIDTWHSTGLPGTGSNSVAVEGVFVPQYCTFTLADLARSRADDARCHRVPFAMVAALQFAAPALGAAKAAHRTWALTAAGRRRADGRDAPSTASAQRVITRTSAEIEAAGLLLRQAALRADLGEIGPLAVAENIRDATVAAELCAAATGSLMRASGARALGEEDPVQRRWLDVTAIAAHAALDQEAADAAYARAAFAQFGVE